MPHYLVVHKRDLSGIPGSPNECFTEDYLEKWI